jgi:hypothetical protein
MAPGGQLANRGLVSKRQKWKILSEEIIPEKFWEMG